MQWLNKIADELIARHGDEEIVVSSGVSPSGQYHVGTLREVLTAEIIAIELRRRGKESRHLHIVDDLDVFRKVPVGVSDEWQKYLGMPLCDVPSPDGQAASYADYFLKDLYVGIDKMHLTAEVVRAHEKYRQGFFAPAIEKALENVEGIRTALTSVSGRELDKNWTPIQVVDEAGRIKNRSFKKIDEQAKVIEYDDINGELQKASYIDGHVKLNWRVDWPARWWLLGVNAEPFGRDHATKGGSYDTGVEIARKVFSIEPPIPVPYHFVNRSGETKKMSKSAGNVVTLEQLLSIMPPELVWYFMLRMSPDKQLFFDEGETLLRLFDDFAALLEKENKESWEKQLIDLSLHSVSERTVSNVPFSHLVASYQAALRNVEKTLEIIQRSEYAEIASKQADIIRRELVFIDAWLDTWAPEELKFSLRKNVDMHEFSDIEKQYFDQLAEKITSAPTDLDGAWFHQAIYDFKDKVDMPPRELFSSLYRLIIGKTSGPRAGWFLSILPRDWLINRLKGKD